MWTYRQSTGELTKPDGTRLGYGFAGQAEGLNNPAHQDMHNIGPLPQGEYTMAAWIESHPHLGACVIMLMPLPSNSMFGRSGFHIHGTKSLEQSGLAEFLSSSEGCICIGDCNTRRGIWRTGDKQLKVVA